MLYKQNKIKLFTIISHKSLRLFSVLKRVKSYRRTLLSNEKTRLWFFFIYPLSYFLSALHSSIQAFLFLLHSSSVLVFCQPVNTFFFLNSSFCWIFLLHYFFIFYTFIKNVLSLTTVVAPKEICKIKLCTFFFLNSYCVLVIIDLIDSISNSFLFFDN